MLLNEPRIVYHAHSVTAFIFNVKRFQLFTGKIGAFKTEIYFALQQSTAGFFQESTLLVSCSAACAVRHFDALIFQVTS